MKKLLSLFLCFTVFAPALSHAEFFVGPGAVGSDFLKIPLTARGTAMGSAFTAVSADANALEYNPAGIAGLDRTDINLTYIDFLEDSSLQAASVAFPLSLNLHSNFRPHPKEDRKKLFVGAQYRLFSADDTARSASGIKLTEFDIRDQLGQLALSYAFTENVFVGVAGKLINRKIQNESLATYAGDAGLIVKLNSRFTTGVSILNVGPSEAFINEKDPLPTLLRVGSALTFNKLLVTFDVSHGRDEITEEQLGFEWSPFSILRLRAGAIFHTDPEFAGGLGLKIKGPKKQPFPPPPSRFKKKRNKLDEAMGPRPPPSHSSVNSWKPKYSNMEIGLDYAVRIKDELGLSHNITLRFLY